MDNTTTHSNFFNPVSQALAELRKRSIKDATRCACEIVLAECHALTKIQSAALDAAIRWANGQSDDRALISAYAMCSGEEIGREAMSTCALGAVLNALDLANVHYNSDPKQAAITLPLNVIGSKRPLAWHQSEATQFDEFNARCIKRISAADAAV